MHCRDTNRPCRTLSRCHTPPEASPYEQNTDSFRQDEPEYYTVGHDNVRSQFDPSAAKNSLDAESVSFLFGGIGVARHLYITLISIAKITAAWK